MRSNGSASVSELTRTLNISPATIRRDLRWLAEQGLVVRTYGGATMPAGPGLRTVEPMAAARKRAIGRAAAGLIEDGETVVIGSGTTALEVARGLIGRRDLTVVTNTLDAVQVLLDQPGIDLIVLGGAVRPNMHSLLGHLTELCARELRADVLVMGIAAFDAAHGLTSDHMPEILTDRALRTMARRVIVVAESMKYGRVEPAFVLPMGETDVLVTDSELPSEAREVIEALGVSIVLAPAEDGP